MSDLLAGARPRRISPASSPAAAFPSATCSVPARAGPSRSSSMPELRDAFGTFFERGDSFALGVCNGCQMLSVLRELIPGSETGPLPAQPLGAVRGAPVDGRGTGRRRRCSSTGMAGSRLPIAVAHGEGRAEFASDAARGRCESRPRRPALSSRTTVRWPSAIRPTRTVRPAGYHGGVQRRRPRHDHDAAPRARDPSSSAVLVTPEGQRATVPGCACSATRDAPSPRHLRLRALSASRQGL
jgi:hypothetical protein